MFIEVKKKLEELQPIEVRNAILTSTGLNNLKKLFRPRMLSSHNRTKEDDELTNIVLSEYFEGDTLEYLSVGVFHRGAKVVKLAPALAISKSDIDGVEDFGTSMNDLVRAVVPCLPEVIALVVPILHQVGFTIADDAVSEIPEEVMKSVRKPASLH